MIEVSALHLYSQVKCYKQINYNLFLSHTLIHPMKFMTKISVHHKSGCNTT